MHRKPVRKAPAAREAARTPHAYLKELDVHVAEFHACRYSTEHGQGHGEGPEEVDDPPTYGRPRVSKITGVICGFRVEGIEDPLMRKIRYLDKVIDELAKGKSMDKILRK